MENTKIPEGFEKVESTIFKFDEVGESVQGKLIAIEDGHNFGNKVYKIETKNAGTVAVFSTAVLESLMSAVPLGKEVVILYTGTKPDSKGRNDIKLFEVYVK